MHFLTLLPGQRFFSVQDWQKMQFSWYDFDICSAKKKVEIWKIAIFYFSAKIVILNTMSKSTVLIIHIIKSFLLKEQNEGRKKRKGLQLAIFLWLWTAKSTFLLLLLLHLFLILPFSVLLYPFSADSGQKVRKLGKAKMVLSSTITVCCWSIF